ncbi:sodium:solute symporter [Luteibaculum oceani]|uniref:Sodium:solute symporter n=2 Tax=Luteibaculum oceani TaxID=1294296 RepID=A0A5C6UV36_9FLAO|nr:sodium:solute symporter [Luteibaculum oceani]
MNWIDWLVLCGTLAFIVLFGWYKNRKQESLSSYFRGNNSLNWWAVGLSVMATQASAITFLSTPGQAYEDGMRFIQFYFGLPLALIVVCAFFIPRFVNLKVFTAYEFLEKRFDSRTRSFTALLFLIQRGLAAGITIYAPAIILSTLLNWPLYITVMIIGVLVIIYTVAGGTQAVAQTQRQQMAVIMVGMGMAFYILLNSLPEEMKFGDALHFAGALGKMNIVDLTPDFSNRYNLWSGLLGGFFLALSYFGTDQSQVARYIGGKDVKAARMGMLFNAAIKIPMQFFILLTGVLVFVFYQFNPAPVFFNSPGWAEAKAADSEESLLRLEEDYQAIEQSKLANTISWEEALDDPEKMERIKSSIQKEQELRNSVKEEIALINPEVETKDGDYVFLHFILNQLPIGLVGLLLAVIFSAAMSSTASEINALAGTTMIDFVKRFSGKTFTEKSSVQTSKLLTLAWGILAIIFAMAANLFDNLIEAVNILGSLFYGTILGVFLVAFFMKKVSGKPTFIAAIIAEAVVILFFCFSDLGFLWFNLLGCALVVILSYLFEVSGLKGSSSN